MGRRKSEYETEAVTVRLAKPWVDRMRREGGVTAVVEGLVGAWFGNGKKQERRAVPAAGVVFKAERVPDAGKEVKGGKGKKPGVPGHAENCRCGACRIARGEQ